MVGNHWWLPAYRNRNLSITRVMRKPKLKQIIIPPITGWRASSIYIVEVAFDEANVIHTALFYTGYLDSKGNPAAYNELLCYEDHETISGVVFMRALSFVCVKPSTYKNLTPNIGKTLEQGNIELTPICINT